jgi:hypothetical protein
MHGITCGKDLIEGLNLNSLRLMTTFVEASLDFACAVAAKAEDKFQFEGWGIL